MSFYDSLFGGSLGDDAPPAGDPAKSTAANPKRPSGPVAAGGAAGRAPTNVPAPVATSSRKPVIPAAWNRALVPPPPPPQVVSKHPAKASTAAVVSAVPNKPPPAAHSAPTRAADPIPAHAPNNTRTTPANPGPPNPAAAKKRGGHNASSDPYAIWDSPYDPNFPTDYAAYREWRDHLRKLRPPPPPPPPVPATAQSHRADPNAIDVDLAPPTDIAQEVTMSESSSESDSSDEESDDDEENLDGEPMGALDLKQFPAFLRMYLDESTDPAILAQRLAVMIPARHLAPEHPPAIRKSKVVVLDNMISAADVDEDLEGETIEECSKFGKVVKCLVRVLQDPPEPSVRIFVRYAKCDGAQAAAAAMHGRFFGGREVRACLYDELWFELGKYDATVTSAPAQSSRSTRR